MMRVAVLCDVKKLGEKNWANGFAEPDAIQARNTRPAGQHGRSAATCIIGQSSGCLFLPLSARMTAQALGTALTAPNPSTILTFQNYNNSNQLIEIPGGAPQLACGLRHYP